MADKALVLAERRGLQAMREVRTPAVAVVVEPLTAQPLTQVLEVVKDAIWRGSSTIPHQAMSLPCLPGARLEALAQTDLSGVPVGLVM